MRSLRHAHLAILAVCLPILPPAAALAQDAGRLLFGIFNEALNEVQRQEQLARERQFRQQFDRLWRQCDGLDVTACDAALRLPLDADSFANVQRLRDKAVRWPDFVADWRRCQPPEPDLTACDAALALAPDAGAGGE